jgi:hypothetical protein
MSTYRMYYVQCDSLATCNGKNDPDDEWYSSIAIARATEEGFHLQGQLAICAECWEAGVRFTALI